VRAGINLAFGIAAFVAISYQSCGANAHTFFDLSHLPKDVSICGEGHDPEFILKSNLHSLVVQSALIPAVFEQRGADRTDQLGTFESLGRALRYNRRAVDLVCFYKPIFVESFTIRRTIGYNPFTPCLQKNCGNPAVVSQGVVQFYHGCEPVNPRPQGIVVWNIDNDKGALQSLQRSSGSVCLLLSGGGETAGIYRSLTHFPSLPAREQRDTKGGESQRASSVSEPPRPLNKIVLVTGVVLMLLGFPLMGRAFEILFFIDERQQGLPIIILYVLCSLVCGAFGSVLIMEMT
jgi:hypothetical protein